jgi:hypothetical protein
VLIILSGFHNKKRRKRAKLIFSFYILFFQTFTFLAVSKLIVIYELRSNQKPQTRNHKPINDYVHRPHHAVAVPAADPVALAY